MNFFAQILPPWESVLFIGTQFSILYTSCFDNGFFRACRAWGFGIG